MTHNNKLCRLLRCKIPLIQAPMLGSVDEKLAVAVARTGAVGSVPCTALSVDALDAMLARHKRDYLDLALTYNFFCHEMPPLSERYADWLTVLAPFFAREKLPDMAALKAEYVASLPSAPTPFSQAHLDVLLRHQPVAVSFHFGLPTSGDVWSQLQAFNRGVRTGGGAAAGVVTMCSATTAAEARCLCDAGVDVLIAQGAEAGGHRGIFLAEPPLAGVGEQMGTFALVPRVRRAAAGSAAVVVAAGGIADADGVRAALALGADAVQVGTAFLLCDEATTNPVHRRALAAQATTTELTNVLSGRPARGLTNAVMREVGALRADAPPYPYAQNAMALLRKANPATPDYATLWCGQNPAGLRACAAADKVAELVRGVDWG